MREQGVDFNSFATKKDRDMAVQAQINAAKKAQGPMAYSTAEDRLIPSPRAQARAQAITTQDQYDASEATKAATAAQDEMRKGVTAENYFRDNPTSQRIATASDYSNDPGVKAAQATGNTTAIEEAVKAARGRSTAETGGASPPPRTSATVGDPATTSSATSPVGPMVDVGGRKGPTTRAVDIVEVAQGMVDEKTSEKARIADNQRKVQEYRDNMYKVRVGREEESAARYDQFVTGIATRDREESQGAELAKSKQQEARASRKIARDAARYGRDMPAEFWERNAKLQATNKILQEGGVDVAERWGTAEVREQEAARNSALDMSARGPDAASFFSDPINNAPSFELTEDVNRFFSGQGRKKKK